MMKYSLMVAVMVLAAACSLLPKPPVETRYTLQPIAAEPAAGVVAGDPSRTIRIDRPEVPLAYRGSRMVLVKGAEQTFYAGKAWEAPVPDLLEAALNRDLAAGLPGWVVAGDGSGLSSAYELQTDVRTFATVQAGSEAAVVMDMDVRLVDPAGRRVLRMLPYRFKQVLPQLTTEATVEAYNRGWRDLVAQVLVLVRG